MNGDRKLLVAVHDVTPVHAERLDKIMPMIDAAIGPGRAALLAVPDFHGKGEIGSNPAFASRLKSWSDAGCEVFLHGYFHQDRSQHTGALAQFKARHLTAGEGEFMGLDRATALARLADGRKRVEDVIGRPTAGFIAPAWLYGEPALSAMAELGFPLAEDHFRVWQPTTGKTLARGPVITYASRTPARLLSSLIWSRMASLLLSPAATVRVGIHPHDWDAPSLIAEIGRTLTRFARTHRPARYAELEMVA